MNAIHHLPARLRNGRADRQSTRSQGFLAGALPIIFCLALFWPFGGGGKKVRMMAGKDTPAARGTITVKTGNNGNTQLKVHVKHLAPPSSLTPPENVYVLWIEPPEQNPRNEGALKVDNNLSGQLQTETSLRRFQVFITAEKQAQLKAPQGPRVLSADVQRG